jgi:hypothetical protein
LDNRNDKVKKPKYKLEINEELNDYGKEENRKCENATLATESEVI